MGLDFHAASFRWEVNRQSGRRARVMIAAFLTDLAERLAEAGSTCLGHLKGMATPPGQEPLFFSLTRLGGEPRFKGGSWEAAASWEMSVSAIVADLSEEEIAQTMQQTLEAHFRSGEEARDELRL